MTELLKMDAGIIIGGRDTAVVYETWISANILQIKSAGQMQHNAAANFQYLSMKIWHTYII